MTDLLQRYRNRLQTDKRMDSLRNRIRGSTNFADANEYAVRSGEILDDEIVFEVSRTPTGAKKVEVDWDALTDEYYQVVTEGATQIQTNLNEAYQIGLEAKRAGFDYERINGIIKDVIDGKGREELINFGQSLVDETVLRNAELHSNVGLKPVIIRKAEPAGSVTRPKIVRSKKGKAYKYMVTYQVPCKWCARLVGEYDYSSALSGSEVFRRHVGCRCEVTYVDEGRSAKDVWSKVEWTYGNAEEQANALAIKQQQAEAAAKQAEVARIEKAKVMEVLMNKYRFTAKNASIFYNMHKAEIAEFGIDYLMRS